MGCRSESRSRSRSQSPSQSPPQSPSVGGNKDGDRNVPGQWENALKMPRCASLPSRAKQFMLRRVPATRLPGKSQAAKLHRPRPAAKCMCRWLSAH